VIADGVEVTFRRVEIPDGSPAVPVVLKMIERKRSGCAAGPRKKAADRQLLAQAGTERPAIIR
jgi:hypothetical protein